MLPFCVKMTHVFVGRDFKMSFQSFLYLWMKIILNFWTSPVPLYGLVHIVWTQFMNNSKDPWKIFRNSVKYPPKCENRLKEDESLKVFKNFDHVYHCIFWKRRGNSIFQVRGRIQIWNLIFFIKISESKKLQKLQKFGISKRNGRFSLITKIGMLMKQLRFIKKSTII